MRHIFFSIFFMWLPSMLFSQSVGEAITLASECLGKENLKVVHQTKTYWIIACQDTIGYAIISQNCGRLVVLGYSNHSCWKEGEMPSALMDWLDGLTEETHVRTRYNEKRRLVEQCEDIAPLLTSHWHQSSPFNDLCPIIEDGNVKTAAGCVAVAAAQVLYFWKKWLPEFTLRDTPTYPYGGAPVTLSIPAGTPNNWHLLKDEYLSGESGEAAAAVAQLVYVLGTSVYSLYGASTGAQITDIPVAIYAQFKMTSQIASKSDYEQDEWEQLLYDNLKEGCPIVYSGTGSRGGHAVVVDGYDAEHNLFHFNFGWGGSGDGFYSVDNVNGMNGYNLGQRCIHKIIPQGFKSPIYTPKVFKPHTAIYNINGMKISDSYEKTIIPKGMRGVYFINGKKFVIQ